MSRELRSCGKKKKNEGKETVAMMSTIMATESSSSSSISLNGNVIKKSVRCAENSILRMRRDNNLMMNESDKENRAGKESCLANNNAAAAAAAGGNSVRQIKAIYEDKLIRRKNIILPGPQNTQPTGTIKKRKKSNLDECGEESKNIIPANKRSNICGEEQQQQHIFHKSRFKVYKDDSRKKCRNESNGDNLEDGKSSNIDDNKIDGIVVVCDETIKPLDEIIPARVSESSDECEKTTGHRGVTPIETFSLSPRPKKVKALHRKSLSSKSCQQSCETAHGSASLYSQYDLPYDDNLIEYELAKEISISNISRQFFQRNITDKQRKIIVKFLTRLNCHLFYPSYFLYQTVKLFDAILNKTVIEIEDLQLNALAAMWIVLKREYNVYKIPTAETMISFSKDLYEGKRDLLLKCEIKILHTLSFNIVFPDPFSILFYNIIKWKNSRKMESKEIATAYYCGNYMIDLSLFDKDLMKISAVLLASAAAEIALYLTMVQAQDTSRPLWLNWRAPHTIQRYSERDIEPVRSTLIRKIFESSQRHNEADIVFKKYTRSRYGRISHFLGTKVRSYLYSPE